MFMDALLEGINEELKKEKTEEQLQKLNDYIDNFDFIEFYKSSITNYADLVTKDLEKTMFEQITYEQVQVNEFLARHKSIWYKGFVASKAMYIIAVESAETYGKYISKLSEEERENKQYLFLALRGLHGRACQEFLEVLCLMENGFADGAYARWRSMYELSIIAEFISNNGEDVAKAYVEDSNRGNRYNWAKVAPCFKNYHKNLSFSDLRKKCKDINTCWNYQYQLANKIVHGSSEGTFYRLGSKVDDINNIIVGRTDFGITTPAEHSAISLSIITSIYLSLFSNSESILSLICLNNWVNIIRKYYFEANNEAFPDNKIKYKDFEK